MLEIEGTALATKVTEEEVRYLTELLRMTDEAWM